MVKRRVGASSSSSPAAAGSHMQPSSVKMTPASGCLVVANLPNRADRSFLNTLFEGKVKDSIWGGYGPGRYAIVSFRDPELPGRVLAARAAYEAWKQGGAAAADKRRKVVAAKSRQSKVNDDEMTLDELLGSSMGVARMEEKVAATEASATAVEDDGQQQQQVQLDPFFGDVRSDCRILFISASPLSIDEIVATGCVPGRGGASAAQNDPAAGEGTTLKDERRRVKPSPSGPAANNGGRCEEADRKELRSQSESNKRPRSESTTVVESPNSRTAAVTASDVAGRDGDAPAAAARTRVREKKPKPPNRTTFEDDEEDHMEVGVSSSTPLKAVRPAEPSADPTPAPAIAANNPVRGRPPPPVAVAPAAVVSFARTSKDQCKFCGSELHLSRHCPNK